MALALCGLIWVFWRLEGRAAERGVARIDATRFRLDAGDRWVGDAWRARLARVLAAAGELDARDAGRLRELRGELSALSFVAEVGELEVLWPDGLRVPLRLHVPVACVRVGDDFLPVAEDGTVLAGYSYAPHEIDRAWLPVLAPLDAALNPPVPGDVLDASRLLDALAVARSMREHLSVPDRRRLGRVVIDASRSEAFDGLPGGVQIDLEGARRVLFGRSPRVRAPGELPAQLKWESVLVALDRLELGESWDLFDVRWDEPVAYARDELPPGAEDR
jgi:hypothetical protein